MTTPNTDLVEQDFPTPEMLETWRTFIEKEPDVQWHSTNVRALLARITRLEAQTAIRGRAVVMYRERARKAEARIKAVQDVLDKHDAMHNSFNVPAHRIRRALGSVTPPAE